MSSFTVPSGILKVNGVLTASGAAHIRDEWERAMTNIRNGAHSVVVLDKAIEFVPFPAPNAVPDAICRYCTVANLSSAAWCTQCGAPMIH